MRWTEDMLTDHLRKRAAVAARPAVDVSEPPFAAPAEDSEPVTITLAEKPQGWARATPVNRGGRILMLTAENTRGYERRIADAARQAMQGRSPFQQPLELILRAVYAIPKSWSQVKRDAAIVGSLTPTCKPDLDNVLKAWKDALNEIVYRDDAQVTDVIMRKRYGPQPLVVVTVRPLS